MLVVIGILIALQVNNWNERRNNILKSHEILREIKRNIEENNKLIHEKWQVEKDVIHSINIIIDNLQDSKNYHDSLNYHFHNSVFWPSSSIKSSGYETLKANGIDLISSTNLKEAIVNLYEVSYAEIDEFIRGEEGYSTTMVMPLFSKLFLFHPEGAKEGTPFATPFDYEKVVASNNYKGVLSFWRNFKYYGNELRKDGIQSGKQVLTFIEAELK